MVVSTEPSVPFVLSSVSTGAGVKKSESGGGDLKKSHGRLSLCIIPERL